MTIMASILEQMSTISTPQRKFVMTLLTTMQLLRGHMTFRNLSRYSDLYEESNKERERLYRGKTAIPLDLPERTLYRKLKKFRLVS